MKKAVVYMAAALLALSAMAGCGKAGDQDGKASPTPTGTPMVTTPEANNGIVNDDDGIITDDDTGRVDADGDAAGHTPDANAVVTPTPGSDKDTHTGASPIPGGNTGASAVAPSASPTASAAASGGKNG